MFASRLSQTQPFGANLYGVMDMFLSYGLFVYGPLVVIGLVSYFKKDTLETDFAILLSLMFLFIFINYPGEFYPYVSTIDLAFVRRYLYILPLLAILSAEGFACLWKGLARAWPEVKKSVLCSSALMLTLSVFNSLSIAYVLEISKDQWPQPLSSLYAFSDLRTALGWKSASLVDLVILVAIIFLSIVVGVYYALIFTALKHKRKSYSASLLILLALSSAALSAYYLQKPLGDILNYGTQTRNMLPDGYQAFVDFFNRIGDNYSILCYQKSYLSTFCDKRVVELSNYLGF
jgi:hypothetical protein